MLTPAYHVISNRLKAVFLACLMVCAISFASVTPATAAEEGAPQYPQQVIMGWVEYVYIQDIDARLKAKLDTGATTSSMRAEVVKIIKPEVSKEDDAEQHTSVIFQIEDEDGKMTTMQRKLVRWVRIKSRNEGETYRRPVVEMEFCVGGRRVLSEVNLAPRSDFVYPILVGRNMLRDAAILVDANKTYTYQSRCPVVPPADE